MKVTQDLSAPDFSPFSMHGHVPEPPLLGSGRRYTSVILLPIIFIFSLGFLNFKSVHNSRFFNNRKIFYLKIWVIGREGGQRNKKVLTLQGSANTLPHSTEQNHLSAPRPNPGTGAEHPTPFFLWSPALGKSNRREKREWIHR